MEGGGDLFLCWAERADKKAGANAGSDCLCPNPPFLLIAWKEFNKEMEKKQRGLRRPSPVPPCPRSLFLPLLLSSRSRSYDYFFLLLLLLIFFFSAWMRTSAPPPPCSCRVWWARSRTGATGATAAASH